MFKLSLATLALASSLSAWADSSTPACQGTGIPAEIRGRYLFTDDSGKTLRLTLKESSVTFDQETPGEAQAWTCLKDGVEVIVLHYPGADTNFSYESRILLRSGTALIVLEEIYRDDSVPADVRLVEFLNKPDDVRILKKL